MATTVADPIIAFGDDTQRQTGRLLHFLRARFMTNGWQHYEEQRMLRALQAIDHPGVLADMQSARFLRAGVDGKATPNNYRFGCRVDKLLRHPPLAVPRWRHGDKTGG